MNPSARALALLGFAGLACMPQAASAQTAAQNAARWGLLGTWRVDCVAPPSRSDSEIHYRVQEGRLYYDRNFGDSQDSHPVAGAQIRPDGSLAIRIAFPGFSQTREFSLIKGGDGRVRAVSNRDVNTNQYSILDGNFTSNGAPTPWQTRCSR